MVPELEKLELQVGNFNLALVGNKGEPSACALYAMSSFFAKVSAAAKTAATATMEAASAAATTVGSAVDSAMGNLAPRPGEEFMPREKSVLAMLWLQQGRVGKQHPTAVDAGGDGGGGSGGDATTA